MVLVLFQQGEGPCLGDAQDLLGGGPGQGSGLILLGERTALLVGQTPIKLAHAAHPFHRGGDSMASSALCSGRWQSTAWRLTHPTLGAILAANVRALL